MRGAAALAGQGCVGGLHGRCCRSAAPRGAVIRDSVLLSSVMLSAVLRDAIRNSVMPAGAVTGAALRGFVSYEPRLLFRVQPSLQSPA